MKKNLFGFWSVFSMKYSPKARILNALKITARFLIGRKSTNQKTVFESRCESYFSKTMEGLLTDCDVLKQLIINRFPDVGEHDQDQWNLVSVKESHFHNTKPGKLVKRCLYKVAGHLRIG